jgi:hypothetical protein
MRSPAAKPPIATVTLVMVGPGAAVRGPTIDPCSGRPNITVAISTVRLT